MAYFQKAPSFLIGKLTDFFAKQAVELPLDGGVEIDEEIVGGVRAVETVVDADEDPAVGNDHVDAILAGFALGPMDVRLAACSGGVVIAGAAVGGVDGIQVFGGNGGGAGGCANGTGEAAEEGKGGVARAAEGAVSGFVERAGKDRALDGAGKKAAVGNWA